MAKFKAGAFFDLMELNKTKAHGHSFINANHAFL